ncbi:RDD family protein [Pseudonocardia oroxyli]|uniref:Uncharacterized membrane protein YckC, RDD family n=1 Tax=Pseudonocardia oroxyli TaxID=366584 RepID=A0A1G7S7C1_PSEOR|nr:RDD family protein [Pseudonocardia oroxyli]SDG18070.1 Uncharacterized membrane protein YckC, RDD family [Pseudonocardia oroxyli]
MTTPPPYLYPSYPEPFPAYPQGGPPLHPYGGPYGHLPPVPPPPVAAWGTRVGSALVDGLVPLVIVGVGLLGFALFDDLGLIFTVAFVCYLAAFAFALWNQCWRQGRTGQSLGKSLVGTRLVRARDGAPVGFGTALGRQFAHVLDGILCIGYLRPLWDERRQTFADSMCDTLVVRVE